VLESIALAGVTVGAAYAGTATEKIIPAVITRLPRKLKVGFLNISFEFEFELYNIFSIFFLFEQGVIFFITIRILGDLLEW
jgi:hypothetical protein